MLIKLNPDFNSNILRECEQKITINVLQNMNKIELDIAEMKIEKEDVKSSTIKILDVKISEKDDKLYILFDKVLFPGTILI
jgi:hypothetical protein